MVQKIKVTLATHLNCHLSSVLPWFCLSPALCLGVWVDPGVDWQVVGRDVRDGAHHHSLYVAPQGWGQKNHYPTLEDDHHPLAYG